MRSCMFQLAKRRAPYVLSCLFLLLGCGEHQTIWTTQFDALGAGDYLINSIDASKKEIYLTGTYTDTSGFSKCFTAKCDNKGKLGWHRVFETQDFQQTKGTAMLTMRTQEELLTARRDIYVLVNAIATDGKHGAILLRYDTLGNLKWQKTVAFHDGPLTSFLLSDQEGSIYVAGWEMDDENRPTIYAGKYDETGKTSWFTKYYSEEIDFSTLQFDIMDPEYLVLAGILENTGQLFHMKCNGSGQFQGFIEYETEKQLKAFSDVMVGPTGNIYISATVWSQESGDDFLLVAYNEKDSLLWASEYDGGTGGNDKSNAIACDDALNIYVTGSRENEEKIPNITIVKYDRTGNMIWGSTQDQKTASNPLMIEPRYLRLNERPYQAYFYLAGKIGDNTQMLRCNADGVFSFQAEYSEPGALTVPTALSGKCMAFARTSESGTDAFVVMTGTRAILGIARWD